MDTRADRTNDASGTGRHTTDAFKSSGASTKDDESGDTGYFGAEGSDKLMFPSTCCHSSPVSGSTCCPQRARFAEAGDDVPVPPTSGNCKPSALETVEDGGMIQRRCPSSSHRGTLGQEVQHQGYNDRAHSAANSSGETRTPESVPVVVGQRQVSLTQSTRKAGFSSPSHSTVVEKTEESAYSAELDFADSNGFMSTGTADASDVTTDETGKWVADPGYHSTLESPRTHPRRRRSGTSNPHQEVMHSLESGAAEENTQNSSEALISKASSESSELDKASCSAIGFTPFSECPTKQAAQEWREPAMASSHHPGKRKLSCLDIQGKNTVIVTEGAKVAGRCEASTVPGATRKRTMTQKAVCVWPTGVPSAYKPRPTYHQLGRVYANAYRALMANDDGSRANIPLSGELGRITDALGAERNFTKKLESLGGQNHDLPSGRVTHDKSVDVEVTKPGRQQSSESGLASSDTTKTIVRGETAISGHQEQSKFPCDTTTSKVNAQRPETYLPPTAAPGETTLYVNKSEERKRTVIMPVRLSRRASLPAAGRKYCQYVKNDSFSHIPAPEGTRTQEASRLTGPHCSHWNTNPFQFSGDLGNKLASSRGTVLPSRTQADPRSAAQASISSENGEACRTTTTGEVNKACLPAGAKQSKSSHLDGRQRTRREPFFSEDPEENEDNHNPGWESFRQLSTDEERYGAVRRVWRNSTVPDPHRNLSRYHHRQRRDPETNPPTGAPGAPASRKRKAPESSAGENPRPAKRKRMDTDVYDLRLEQLKHKTREYMHTAQLALETKLKRLREELQAQKATQSNLERLKHQRASTAPSDMVLWRQREEMLQASFRTRTEQIHSFFTTEIGRLLNARQEVRHVDKFYAGLIDSDPTTLSECQMQEQLNIEKMLELFRSMYGMARG